MPALKKYHIDIFVKGNISTFSTFSKEEAVESFYNKKQGLIEHGFILDVDDKGKSKEYISPESDKGLISFVERGVLSAMITLSSRWVEDLEKNKNLEGASIANILMNIPQKQREWLLEAVPSDLMQCWCFFLSPKEVKFRIEACFKNPEKIEEYKKQRI